MKIKNLNLGKIPRVVGIIDYPITTARLQKFIDRGVDIFEIRVDLFNKPIDKVIDYIKKNKSSIQSPLLGTIRETDFNRKNRIDWYISLAKYVDCIDVELGMPEWRKVADSIAGSPVKMMVSEHDFSGTPNINKLNDIIDRAIDQGAEIVKIATMANNSSDVTRLMRFTEDCKMPVVTMAMGDIGRISRIIAPLFGSLFTYGYLQKPLVPGQLPAIKLADALDQYFPARVPGENI
jgi:3-dehydroquinate dehydratase-1